MKAKDTDLAKQLYNDPTNKQGALGKRELYDHPTSKQAPNPPSQPVGAVPGKRNFYDHPTSKQRPTPPGTRVNDLYRDPTSLLTR